MHENMITDITSMLRISVIFAFLISGSFFMISSITYPSITGSIVGQQVASYDIILGVTLFLISLSVAHHHDSKNTNST